MSTSIDDIRRWLEEAPKGSTHMLVVCDTFDYEDYPVYVKPAENVYTVAQEHNGPNMTKLMEVYSFSPKYTIEGQLGNKGFMQRTRNYD